jgi:transcriptional repressor NrdR
MSCGHRFTTFERIEPDLTVVKRDGTRQPFEREKLLRVLSLVCAKRSVKREKLEELVDGVMSDLSGFAGGEVTSRQIAEAVMRRLKETDHVAFVRYAASYRDFQDITSVRENVAQMLSRLEQEAKAQAS